MRSKSLVGMMVLVLAAGSLIFAGCGSVQTIESDAEDVIVESVEKDTSAAVEIEKEEADRRAAEVEKEEAARRAAELEKEEADRRRRAAEVEEEARLEAEREKQRLAAEEKARQSARNRFINEHIRFEFDSAALTLEAIAVLKEKAAWLRDWPSVEVTIQGHCDERGTDEYNLALGERRAQSAKDFLQYTGISPWRLDTVSYGEESPLDPRPTEEAWAKNRRAQFVIK